jgi:hypothetical protein
VQEKHRCGYLLSGGYIFRLLGDGFGHLWARASRQACHWLFQTARAGSRAGRPLAASSQPSSSARLSSGSASKAFSAVSQASLATRRVAGTLARRIHIDCFPIARQRFCWSRPAGALLTLCTAGGERRFACPPAGSSTASGQPTFSLLLNTSRSPAGAFFRGSFVMWAVQTAEAPVMLAMLFHFPVISSLRRCPVECPWPT